MRSPPTDREIALVTEIYRIAEMLPLDVALMVLMSAVTMLIRGSGHSDEMWGILIEGAELQRKFGSDGQATHPPPPGMQ